MSEGNEISRRYKGPDQNPNTPFVPSWLINDPTDENRFTPADYCPACKMLRSQCECIDPVNQP